MQTKERQLDISDVQLFMTSAYKTISATFIFFISWGSATIDKSLNIVTREKSFQPSDAAHLSLSIFILPFLATFRTLHSI